MMRVPVLPLSLSMTLLFCMQVYAQPTPPTQQQDSAPSAEQMTPPKPADEDYTLENSLNIRDPFRRPMPKSTLAQDGGNEIDDLERYELDKYKLVGVITGPKKRKALLTSPTGKMHIVSENMHIGNRRGVIKKIAPGMITIEEKLVNILGQEELIESNIQFATTEKGSL